MINNSRNFMLFLNAKDSLPCLQQTGTGSSSVIVKQFKPSLLIAVRSITLSSHLCLLPSAQVPSKDFLCISHLSHVYYSRMPNPPHSLWFDQHNALYSLRSMKLPILHLSASFSILGSSTLLSTFNLWHQNFLLNFSTPWI